MRIYDDSTKKQIDMLRAKITRLELELQNDDPGKVITEEIKLRLVRATAQLNSCLNIIGA